MNQRRLLWNAGSTCVQVLVNAGILFLLYRFLLDAIGIGRLGVWSLVLATTSAVTLANQGFSTSIVKFVAKYAAQGDPAKVSRLMQTALLATGLFFGLVSVVIYPASRCILAYLLPGSRLQEGLLILPYSLVSLWLNLLNSVSQAGLIGHELVWQRNAVLVIGLISYLVGVLLLVPHSGLLGLAVAQVAQAGLVLTLSWFLLRREVPSLGVLPHQWDHALFREMLRYAVHFQFVTITQALREPLTKGLLTRFGGLAYTGFYDMASRWIFTFREFIVQANQVLVPTVSGLTERDPKSLPNVYRDSYRLLSFVSVPAFTFLIVISPAVSRLWIGHYEELFVRFSMLLAFGWLFNVLSNPAYVLCLGTGSLRWVTVGCLVTLLLNLVLGISSGWVFGGTGVVTAAVVAMVIGSATMVTAYHIHNQVPIRMLLPRENLFGLAAAILGVLVFLPIIKTILGQSLLSPLLFLAVALAFLGIVAIPIWVHPLRKRIVNRVVYELPFMSSRRTAN